LATPNTPEIDPSTLKIRDEMREEKWAKQRVDRALERDQQSEEWWRRYNEYLATEEWRNLRQLVFRRDDGICQGCYAAPATQVHHLTYEHVCNEFLWELTSICDGCHARVHDNVET
jgi:5-methylcytosine-specific restriction endonuclease McrA